MVSQNFSPFLGFLYKEMQIFGGITKKTAEEMLPFLCV